MIPLLVAAVLVLLVYLLRPPAQKILVPSTLLWEQLVEQSANRQRLLRWLLSLLLSTLIVLLGVSVFFRLEPSSGSLINPVLLIDNTGSMASLARSGASTTRLDLARQKALEILDRSTGIITIADLAGTVGPIRFDNAAEARRLVTTIRLRVTATPRIPEHLFRARALDHPAGNFFLLTDTATLPASLSAPSDSNAPNLEVVDVSMPAENLGITHFRVATTTPGIIGETPDSAYLEILNGGDQRATGHLVLEVFPAEQVVHQRQGQQTTLLRRALDIEAGMPWSAALDLQQAYQAFPHQPIAVRATVEFTQSGLSNRDVQPLDDEAWLILEPTRTLLRPASGSSQSLPRWLNRIISTSERLDLASSSAEAKAAIVLYQQLPSTPQPPCMLLPPRFGERARDSRSFDLHRVTLSLPNQPPLQLPWTQVTAQIPTQPEAASVWIRGETVTAPSGSSPDSDPQAAPSQTNPTQGGNHRPQPTLDLVHGPNPSSPCTTWSFDPLASQLETRAEFPVLVESVLAATAAAHRRASSNGTESKPDQEFVAGAWRPILDPTGPSATSFLSLRNGQLVARKPLGAFITRVRERTSIESANDAVQPTGTAATLGAKIDTESPRPFWRWPGRIAVLVFITLLLLVEATTRFAGITE